MVSEVLYEMLYSESFKF